MLAVEAGRPVQPEALIDRVWGEQVPRDPRAAVYDVVYNPRETLFVRQARAAGLRAETGLGMLVSQAALSFETWTGRAPSIEAMFAAVEA